MGPSKPKARNAAAAMILMDMYLSQDIISVSGSPSALSASLCGLLVLYGVTVKHRARDYPTLTPTPFLEKTFRSFLLHLSFSLSFFLSPFFFFSLFFSPSFFIFYFNNLPFEGVASYSSVFIQTN